MAVQVYLIYVEEITDILVHVVLKYTNAINYDSRC